MLLKDSSYSEIISVLVSKKIFLSLIVCQIYVLQKVRKLGSILNIPESFLKRHPFPEPGLAVRIPSGDVTEGNALEVLRQV